METYVLHVTHRCNLRCLYCYEQERDLEYSKEELIKSCELIGNNTNTEFLVEFIGGEPLLAFDNIVTAYDWFQEYAVRTKKNIYFVVSTNLTLLTSAMLDWFKTNRIKLSVSLDGDRYNNQLRVFPDRHSSYELVVKNLTTALAELGVDRVGVHMVSHPYNVGFLAHNILHIHSLGVADIAVGIIESTILIGKEFCEAYIKGMNEISLEIMNNYPQLHVSELSGLKPTSDVRNYVYDDLGKPIFETYGRSTDDVVSRGEVKAITPGSPVGGMIDYIRGVSYELHQSRINSVKPPIITVDDHIKFDCNLRIKKLNDLTQVTATTGDSSSTRLYSDQNKAEQLALLDLFRLNSDQTVTVENVEVPITTLNLGIGLTEYQSICHCLEQYLANYTKNIPRVEYSSKVLSWIESQGYTVIVKPIYDWSSVIVYAKDSRGVKVAISTDLDLEVAIENALSKVLWENYQTMDLKRCKVVKLTNYRKNLGTKELYNVAVVNGYDLVTFRKDKCYLTLIKST